MRVINFGLGKSNNDWCLWAAAAEKEILEEEGDKGLMPSSTMLRGAVLGLRLRLCGRRRQTVPSDDDVQYLCCTTSSLVIVG